MAARTIHSASADQVLCQVAPLSPPAGRESGLVASPLYVGKGVVRSLTPSPAGEHLVLVEAQVSLPGDIPYALNWSLVSCQRAA